MATPGLLPPFGELMSAFNHIVVGKVSSLLLLRSDTGLH